MSQESNHNEKQWLEHMIRQATLPEERVAFIQKTNRLVAELRLYHHHESADHMEKMLGTFLMKVAPKKKP